MFKQIGCPDCGRVHNKCSQRQVPCLHGDSVTHSLLESTFPPLRICRCDRGFESEQRPCHIRYCKKCNPLSQSGLGYWPHRWRSGYRSKVNPRFHYLLQLLRGRLTVRIACVQQFDR